MYPVRSILLAVFTLLLAACGGGGGGGDSSSSPPAAATDENPAADYAGTPFTVVSRIIGPASQFLPEVRLTELMQRDGVWYGVSRFRAGNITLGSLCFQALNRTRITTCDGFPMGDSATPGAVSSFLLDPQTNGAVFHTVVTPPELGGADTQHRMTLTPMVAGWASATYAGAQKPRLALVASKYFVLMDAFVGGLGSGPMMSEIDYGARYLSTGLSFPTPQPIDTALFGLANLHTPAYPSVMDFDFATHDGRNGFYAFTSRPDTKGPLSGGSVAGALNLWRHDGTSLAPMASLPLAAVAKPINTDTISYWVAHGVRLVRNAAQPTRPLIVVKDETKGTLDIYRYDGTGTLQTVVIGVVPPADFRFAGAPMAAVNSTLYLAAGKAVYKLVGSTPTVMAGDHFRQGGSLSPFTDVDVLASDGTALFIGIGREFTDYRHTVADVLRLPL